MGESKGNFLDFIEDASGEASPIRKELLEALSKGVTADELLNLFHRLGYDGVSLEDCGKLVNVAALGPIPCNIEQRY